MRRRNAHHAIPAMTRRQITGIATPMATLPLVKSPVDDGDTIEVGDAAVPVAELDDVVADETATEEAITVEVEENDVIADNEVVDEVEVVVEIGMSELLKFICTSGAYSTAVKMDVKRLLAVVIATLIGREMLSYCAETVGHSAAKKVVDVAIFMQVWSPPL